MVNLDIKKDLSILPKSLFLLEPPIGIEPTTY